MGWQQPTQVTLRSEETGGGDYLQMPGRFQMVPEPFRPQQGQQPAPGCSPEPAG